MRKLVLTVLILLAAFFWYVTLTAPMYAITGPALISIAISVALFFAWTKFRKTV